MVEIQAGLDYFLPRAHALHFGKQTGNACSEAGGVLEFGIARIVLGPRIPCCQRGEKCTNSGNGNRALGE